MKKILLLLLLPLFVSCSNAETANGETIENNLYDTITYGTFTWAIESADVVTYRDGTPIPQVSDLEEWIALETGAWCYVNNDPTSRKLYNGFAVAGIHDKDPQTPNKVFAPKGWRVPSGADWENLKTYLEENNYLTDYEEASGRVNTLSASIASKDFWQPCCAGNSTSYYNYNVPGKLLNLNNSSGFTAYPDGTRFGGGVTDQEGNFLYVGEDANFWTSDNYFVTIQNNSTAVFVRTSPNIKELSETGRQVRLIKN